MVMQYHPSKYSPLGPFTKILYQNTFMNPNQHPRFMFWTTNTESFLYRIQDAYNFKKAKIKIT